MLASSLNTTGQSRVTLSLQQQHLRAACGLRQEERSLTFAPKTRSSQAFAATCTPVRAWLVGLGAQAAHVSPPTRPTTPCMWELKVSAVPLVVELAATTDKKVGTGRRLSSTSGRESNTTEWIVCAATVRGGLVQPSLAEQPMRRALALHIGCPNTSIHMLNLSATIGSSATLSVAVTAPPSAVVHTRLKLELLRVDADAARRFAAVLNDQLSDAARANGSLTITSIPERVAAQHVEALRGTSAEDPLKDIAHVVVWDAASRCYQRISARQFVATYGSLGGFETVARGDGEGALKQRLDAAQFADIPSSSTGICAISGNKTGG